MPELKSQALYRPLEPVEGVLKGGSPLRRPFIPPLAEAVGLPERLRGEVEYAQLLLAQGHTLTIRWWSQEQEAVKKVLKDLVGKGGSARRKRRGAP